MFPKSASVEQLKLIRESIATERDQRLRRGQTVPSASQTALASASPPESSAAVASSQGTAPAPSQPPSLVKRKESDLCPHFLLE